MLVVGVVLDVVRGALVFEVFAVVVVVDELGSAAAVALLNPRTATIATAPAQTAVRRVLRISSLPARPPHDAGGAATKTVHPARSGR